VQAGEALLPFLEFGIGENGVLNDLIALIFAAKGSGGRFGLGGAHEGAEFGMKERGLGVDVEKRRRGALEAERETVGPSEAGADRGLRDVVVAQLAVGGGGVLLVGGRDGCAVGVFEPELHGVTERDGFGEEGSGQEEEQRQGKFMNARAVPRSIFHISHLLGCWEDSTDYLMREK